MTLRNHLLALAALLSTFLLPLHQTAWAVNWTQTAGGTFDWDDNGNWDAAFPDAAAAVANLNLDITGDQAINLNANRTIGSLTIGDTDSSNTFTINAGSSLIFDNGGSSASLTKTAGTHATPDLISAPIVLSDNLNIAVNSAHNSNSVAGGLRISGGISDGGSALGITKTGPGTLSLQGGAGNTYTGPTVINGGTLVVQTANSIPDASAITVNATGVGEQAVLRFGLSNAGVADTIGSLTLGGGTTTSQPIVNVSFNATVNFNGDVTYDATNNPLGALFGVNTGGSPWSSGTISLGGGTRTYNIGDSSSAASDLTILHRIQNGSIIKEGPGQMAFTMASGQNTLTNIWVKEGNLYTSQPHGLGGSVTIGDSSGSNNILVSGDRGGNTSFVIAGGNTGSATISGHFGIGGGTTFWGGAIQLGDINGAHDLTIRSTLGPVFRGDITGNGDLTMNANGSTLTWDVNTTSINHNGLIDTGTAGNVFVTAIIGPNVTGVNVNGGTMRLSGANTHDSTTTVNAGTLQLNHVDALQNSTLDTGPSGGQQVTFFIAGTNTYNIGGLQGTDALAIGANTISVGGNSDDTTFNGAITGTGGLTKVGDGTLTLTSGSLGYNGDTNVDDGTLLVNGTHTGGGVYNVNTGGTLGGIGSTASDVVINAGGNISPGSSPGTFSTGSETWNPDGNYTFEINDALGTAGADPGWDLLDITGSLTINSSLGNEFNILLTSLDLGNSPGDAANFDHTFDYAWLLAESTSTISSYTGTDQFFVDTSAFTNFFLGTFSVQRGDTVLGGSDVQLYLVYDGFAPGVVPEPSTYLLALAGLAGLGLVAYRRRRALRTR